jgi:hypothetical protein
MADCNDQRLAECLIDDYALTCCSCAEAERLRCIALARLKELTCGCMSRPVTIGSGDGAAKFVSPVEAMDALRKLIEMTYMVCERSAENDGPLLETIWQDRCGGASWVCGCPSDRPWDRFHQGSTCDSDSQTPSNRC